LILGANDLEDPGKSMVVYCPRSRRNPRTTRPGLLYPPTICARLLFPKGCVSTRALGWSIVVNLPRSRR
jgi:hypothetical protein